MTVCPYVPIGTVECITFSILFVSFRCVLYMYGLLRKSQMVLACYRYSTKSEITGNSWDQTVMDCVGEHWECKESSTNYREELNLLLIQLTGSKQTSNSSQDVICLKLFDTDENDSV